jgi:glutamate-5-semialdehyde dehydrogenase
MRPKIKISELPDFDAAEFLQTDADIAAYLSTVLEENDAGLLAAALGDIARARGMTQVAKEAGITREALYKALRPGSEPRFETVSRVCAALGVKLVADVNEALAHMREHNAGHSDAILTNDLGNAERFVNGAGSAAVYVNASTRFTDGGQFGLGAEVAVSTQMLHARGPMGLTELTSYKWVGQADYLSRA